MVTNIIYTSIEVYIELKIININLGLLIVSNIYLFIFKNHDILLVFGQIILLPRVSC